ncbi:hypothetical protein [Roseivivax sp. CAU 1761]
MPLFACTKCNAVENTATGWYWLAKAREEAQCSECRTGAWHGHFPKQDAGESWRPDPRNVHPKHLPPFLVHVSEIEAKL